MQVLKRGAFAIMQATIWNDNLKQNRHTVRSNAGPGHVAVVSGTMADHDYWQKRFALTKSAIFRSDSSTEILSVHEQTPKGNFLGTLIAWQALLNHHVKVDGNDSGDIALISMFFGKGTRLSPFTQTLGNCKSRFPTPYKCGENGVQLTIGELSNLYCNLLTEHLRDGGFKGLVVKWGDEIMIPGCRWSKEQSDYSHVDAVRFVCFTEPTPELAREKDWVLTDSRTGLMTFQLARQSVASLRERSRFRQRFLASRLGVNLGSLAISYDFLNVAFDEFGDYILNPQRRVDWDPYLWMALSCQDRQEWLEEIKYGADTGNTNIVKFESQHPEFFQKISRVKKAVETRNGRPFAVKVLDYGDVFWADFGQHLALRNNLAVLLDDSDRGALTRDLFNIPRNRDALGNTIVNSTIHRGARIRNSLIIDSFIGSAESIINRGIVVGSTHRTVRMLEGGMSLLSTVGNLHIVGENAIAFQSIAPEVSLTEGGRHTTLVSPKGIYQLMSNESVTDYTGTNYSKPLFSNVISFEEASAQVGGLDSENLECIRDNFKAPLLKQIMQESD
jgi:hypothetical protein